MLIQPGRAGPPYKQSTQIAGPQTNLFSNNLMTWDAINRILVLVLTLASNDYENMMPHSVPFL